MAKWLVLKEETLNNDILLHICTTTQPNCPNQDCTNICSFFFIKENQCLVKLFKFSLYHQSPQFKNLQIKEFSRLKN